VRNCEALFSLGIAYNGRLHNNASICTRCSTLGKRTWIDHQNRFNDLLEQLALQLISVFP
jgi:hypothetical protein